MQRVTRYCKANLMLACKEVSQLCSLQVAYFNYYLIFSFITYILGRSVIISVDIVFQQVARRVKY